MTVGGGGDVAPQLTESCKPASTPVPAQPTHRRDLRLRWVMLALASLAPVGNYYAFDNPASLNVNLRSAFVTETHALTLEQFDYSFSMLYSLYSMPNVVLPLLFGLLMDRVGIRIVLVLLSVFLLAGQALLAAGVQTRNMQLMLAARLVFGIGGESTTVAQTALLTSWFGGKELAFALAVQLSIGRAGSVLNDVLAPMLATERGLDWAMWFGVGAVGAATVLTVCLAWLDWWVDARVLPAMRAASGTADSAIVAVPDDMEGGVTASAVSAPDRPVARWWFPWTFTPMFWLVAGVSVLLYSSMLPFNNVAGAVFSENQFHALPLHMAQVEAGRAMSLLFLLPVLLGPLSGAALDWCGRPTLFMLLASVLVGVAHASALRASPYVSMALMGLGYALFATSIWPSIPATVAPNEVGSAFGVATGLQNLGMALMPMLVASIRARTGSYSLVETTFALVSFAAFLLVIYLHTRASVAKHALAGPELPSWLRNARAKLIGCFPSALVPPSSHKHKDVQDISDVLLDGDDMGKKA